MGLCGSAPTPDPLIGQAAQLNADTAKEALAWYKDLYNKDLLPLQKDQADLSKKLVGKYLDTMDEQSLFAKEQNEYYKETFKPIEQQMAKDALGYDSSENIEKRAGIATANVEQQFSNAVAENNRNLSRYGVNPNSSAFAATNERLMRDAALAKAGAATGAAFDTQDKAIALRAGASNFGRNMPNTAAAYYAGGNNSGGSALSAGGAGINAYSAGADVMGRGFNAFQSGMSSAGNLALGNFNAQMQGYAADQQAVSGLMQGVGTFAGMAYKSSKDLKEDKAGIQDGRALEAIERMDIEHWKYKDGVEDSNYHVGPYAEDFRRETGMGDGRGIRHQDAIGITMRAVQDLAKEVRSLKGGVQHRADGGNIHHGHGRVSGPGGPVDDQVPAMLSDGEYVMPADVVKAKGVEFFDRLKAKYHTPAHIQRRQAIQRG